MLALIALALAPACGGDDPEAQETDAGGSSSTASDDECKSLHAPTIVVDQISADEFALAGNELFFVDPDSSTLKKASLDGRSSSTLVQLDSTQQVGSSILVDGDDVFFLLGNSTDDEDNLPIQRVSRAGGTPSKLASTMQPATGRGIFASDETSLYTTDYDTFVARVSKQTGEVQYVVKDQPNLASPQLYDGKIYFADVDSGDILSIDKSATNGTGAVVLKEACSILYDLSISQSHIACGLDVYDWQGTKTNFLSAAGRLTPQVEGAWFGYSNDHHTLWQVKFDPYQGQLLACDVNSAISAVRANATDVYWLNVRTVDHKAVRSINRIARR